MSRFDPLPLVLGVLFAFSTLSCVAPVQTTADPVSAGSAKLFLETGKTSQAQVIEAFGGPNIVAGGADGRETWTYDRMSYASSEVAGGGTAGAAGVIGSVPVGGLFWGHAAKASTSSRSVTLFLYWKNGILDDYKYRSASF